MGPLTAIREEFRIHGTGLNYQLLADVSEIKYEYKRENPFSPDNCYGNSENTRKSVVLGQKNNCNILRRQWCGIVLVLLTNLTTAGQLGNIILALVGNVQPFLHFWGGVLRIVVFVIVQR